MRNTKLAAAIRLGCVLYSIWFVVAGIPALMRSFSDIRSALLASALGVGVLLFYFARPHINRLLFPFLLALIIFWAASLIYNAPEIKRFRNILQFTLFIDRTPWTPGHSVGFALGFATITFLWRSWEVAREPEGDQDIWLSGPRLIPYQHAYAVAANELRPGDENIFWAGVVLPRKCATQHFVVPGSPGSGKSMTLQLLMQSAFLRFFPGSNRRAVIYDAKRDTYAFLKGLFKGMENPPPIYIFNPFDRRASPWAMNLDIQDGATALQIATILIGKDAANKDTNKFFFLASCGLLGGVMEAFAHFAPKTWTFRDVVLAMRDLKRVRRIIGHCPHTRYLIGKYLSDSQRDSDIEATIEASIRPLSFVAANWYHSTKPAVSLSEWSKSDGIIILGSDPSLDVILNVLNRALFQRLVELVRSMPELRSGDTRETWFILDELRNAGRFENLDKLCSEGRSKGACVALGFQDLSGLCEVYGDKAANSIIGVCNNKLFLHNGDQATIDYATKHFKEQEILEIRYSYSHSDSTSDKDGGGSSSDGSSVSRKKVMRPVVHSGLLKSLPQPEIGRTGIHGYADTARVGTNYPYRMDLPHTFLDQHLPRPDENTENFQARPPTDYILPDWTLEDLERLNLSDFPELLLHDEQPNTHTTTRQQPPSDTPESSGEHDIFGV